MYEQLSSKNYLFNHFKIELVALAHKPFSIILEKIFERKSNSTTVRTKTIPILKKDSVIEIFSYIHKEKVHTSGQ